MEKAVIDTSRLAPRKRGAGRPKGRQVDPEALAEVRSLLGDSPRRRDLLIEFLHRIQDAHGSIAAAHIVALAQEMRLAMTEVYEVATFYHHFDVVKEGDAPPPPLTVRVCETLSCRMAGSEALQAELAAACGSEVRVIGAPCIGRCDQAPAAVVGRNPVDRATVDSVMREVAQRRTDPELPACIDYAAYRAGGGYALFEACVRGDRPLEEVLAAMESSGLRGLGGAGFPVGRKWRIVRGEPAPRLMAINIDEGEPGTFKDRYYLERDPHRFLEGALIAAWAVGIDDIYIYLRDEYAACRAILAREIAALEAGSPSPLPRLHLRRGAGAYICGEESAMIESIEGKRGMPRLRPPYVAQVGLFGRPTLEHNMETLHWVREILEKGARLVRGPRPPRAQGSALVLGVGPRREAGRASRAGGHHRARADRRALRRHAARSRVLRLPPGRRVGRHPARVARRRSPRFRHAAAARRVHRLGCGDRAFAARPRARCGAQPDALLRRRVLRPVHAVPRGHRKGGRVDGAPAVGCAAPRRARARDDRRVDLRARTGRAEPVHVGDTLLPG